MHPTLPKASPLLCRIEFQLQRCYPGLTRPTLTHSLMTPIRGGRGKGTGASTIHAQGGLRWYFYVYALLGTHCARQVILLTACVFAQRVRRSRHSFWNHPRRAQSGLQDISRTLLRVDLICRHDVSGGGNFSHQVSIRGWSSCVGWEGKQTETRGVHTLFARRLGHNHDFGCSLPAVRWPLVLNTFYILRNSPQHPCPAHSDTLRTLTTSEHTPPSAPSPCPSTQVLRGRRLGRGWVQVSRQ